MGRAVWRNGCPENFAVVGDPANDQDSAVGHFRPGKGEVLFGVFRAAVDFELVPGLLEVAADWKPPQSLGHDLDVGVDLRGNEIDVKGFVVGGIVFLGGARAQGRCAAGLIEGGVFLELGEDDFLVLALEGGAHQIINQSQQDGGAEGEDQRVPEAEAEGEIAEELI